MNRPPMFLACVLRGVSGVFFVLDDAGHSPFGVGWVDTLADRVRVYYAEPVTRIAAIQATSDETYVRAGIAAGVSGALTHADVFFARGGVPVTPVDACLRGSNVWITGWAAPAASGAG